MCVLQVSDVADGVVMQRCFTDQTFGEKFINKKKKYYRLFPLHHNIDVAVLEKAALSRDKNLVFTSFLLHFCILLTVIKRQEILRFPLFTLLTHHMLQSCQSQGLTEFWALYYSEFHCYVQTFAVHSSSTWSQASFLKLSSEEGK